MTKDTQQETMRKYPLYSVRFSNLLLRKMMECNDENIAVAPSRLQAVLILIANWATPEIRERILGVVGGGGMTLQANIDLCSKNIILPLPDRNISIEEDEIPQIELQTLLWIQRMQTVNPNAIDRVSDGYNITIKEVDFRNPMTKTGMDETVCKSTHGKITQLEMEMKPDMMAVITDILYFKASWEEAFDKYATYDQFFWGTKGFTKVPMMRRSGSMSYGETDSLQTVKLYYQCETMDHKSFSMRIYLPKEGYDVRDVLLTIEENNYGPDYTKTEVNLTMPKFMVESGNNMKDILDSLELGCVFESHDVIPNCVKDLTISDIKQLTKIEIDESGTEATAVSYFSSCMAYPGMVIPEPIIMRVDRPFIFEIAEETSNTILFCGVINNLTKDH